MKKFRTIQARRDYIEGVDGRQNQAAFGAAGARLEKPKPRVEHCWSKLRTPAKHITRALSIGLLVMVLGVAGTAFAASGVGAAFNLGQVNNVNAQTSLAGSSATNMVHVNNKSNGSTARAIGAVSNGQGATVNASNNGSGPAASFNVTGNGAPFTVNSATQVPNLNAQFLQGDTPASFYAVGSKVADSQHADLADYATTAATANNTTAVDGLQVRSFSYYAAASTGSEEFLSLGGLVMVATCASGTDLNVYVASGVQNAYFRDSSGATGGASFETGSFQNIGLPGSGSGSETLVYNKSPQSPTSFNAPTVTVTLSYEQQPTQDGQCSVFGTAVGAP